MKNFYAITLLTLVSGSAIANDAFFTLVNKSDYVISELYASPINTDDWEDDILGQDVLDPGQRLNVTVSDGSDQCEYDMKVVDEDGEEHILEGLDICEDALVEFTK